jgi:hypothetical protein
MQPIWPLLPKPMPSSAQRWRSPGPAGQPVPVLRIIAIPQWRSMFKIAVCILPQPTGKGGASAETPIAGLIKFSGQWICES